MSAIILLMTTFFIFVTIIQTFAISLGTGASTLAILNFFVAIADGAIDETERRMMGIVYKVLRVAMVAILLSTILIIANVYVQTGWVDLPAFYYAQMFILFILFVNAMLMTAHLIPSTFGPGIQAGSWYTLGTLAALQITGLTDFTFTTFILGYVAWIVLAIGIVNGVMAILKSKKSTADSTTKEQSE